MARRDDVHVWPDHHVIPNIDPRKVIDRAVLIYEYPSTDMNFLAAGRVEGRNEAEMLIDVSAGQLAE